MNKLYKLVVALLFPVSVMFDAIGQDITSGLVAYYQFEETNSSSGNSVADAAGSHTGTIVGGGITCNLDGKIGKAFNFSGNSYIDLTNTSADITGYQEFTIAAWVNPSSLTNTKTIISSCTPNRDFDLQYANGYIDVHHALYPDIYFRCYATSPGALFTWVHLVCTWKNNQWKVYHNGVLQSTCDYSANPIPWTGQYIQIGALANLENFSGLMDEVRIYNRALSATDVSALFAYTGESQTPSLSVNDISVNESAGTATFTISMSSTSTQTVTGSYATSNGTATSGSDYTAASGSFSIPSGQTSTTVNVAITNDAIAELNETFNLTISNPSNASISDATGICTIVDNDTPSLSVNDITVNESAGTATFTISMSSASTQTVSGNYATSNGTATAGSDYTATSGSFSIPSGQTSTTVNVAITNDAVVETNETFNLTISNPSNATISDATGVCTIINVTSTLSVNDISVNESAGTASFTISMSSTSTQTVTGSYATSNGTATSGSDYTAASGSFSISSGQTSTTVNVAITDDAVVESNETFNLTILNPLNAVIYDATGICTIIDNDLAALWNVNGSNNIYNTNLGFVGIGTSNPDKELTVRGKIHASEVIVDSNLPAPDYVFNPEYSLTKLYDLEKYLKENNHLPELPDAKTLEQEGISLSVVNMTLLKKIEELTLYIIDHEKRINNIEKIETPKK